MANGRTAWMSREEIVAAIAENEGRLINADVESITMYVNGCDDAEINYFFRGCGDPVVTEHVRLLRLLKEHDESAETASEAVLN